MKCERCKSRATVHIIDIGVQGIRDFHLCAECAREVGYDLMPDDISFEQVLQRLINDSSELLERGSKDLFGDSKRKCDICDITLGEIIRETHTGCEEDFTVFRDEIRDLLRTFHGETQHFGKSSNVSNKNSSKQKSLQVLQKRLDEAVKAENFELAAQFRDEIKGLK